MDCGKPFRTFFKNSPRAYGILSRKLRFLKTSAKASSFELCARRFRNLPVSAIPSRFLKKCRYVSFEIQCPGFYFETGFRLWVGRSKKPVHGILIKGFVQKLLSFKGLAQTRKADL